VKVLIADPLPAAATERLRAAGHEVVEQSGLQGEALARALEGCQGLIVRSATKVTAEVLRGAPSLRAVTRAGTGLDNVDAEAARARGIAVHNTPAANAVSVAELVIGLLLAFERRLVPAATAMADGRWEKKRLAGREIAGRTLGLVGFGRIAREVAMRARGFAMHVRACDPMLVEWPEGFDWVRRTELDELLKTSDVVSVHVPLSEGTRNLVDARALGLMRADAVLVNCARGGIVDEPALHDALVGNRLRGAAVDVFATEPPGDHPLLALPSVIATPHLGASTAEAQQRAGVEAAERMIEALASSDAATAHRGG
jgi:D-3-phosphoglycerate dehydrogenase